MAAQAGQLGTYIIKGGEQGKARLSVLARVLEPSTGILLDRFEPLAGRCVVDAGCGGGDVSFELAERVGPAGSVVAFDLDEGKLGLALRDAQQRGVANVAFRGSSVLDPWPAERPALAYARFVLTHLRQPEAMLAQALACLAPGGVMVTEDIDFDGHFCDPPCPAFDAFVELYVASARARGCDPFIGRRLARLLEDAGFVDVGFSLVQPHGRSGDVKQMASLTFAAIADTAVGLGLATPDRLARIGGELAEFAADPRTTTSLPRIFQAWGYKPGN